MKKKKTRSEEYNRHIVIQKLTENTDGIGNHTSEWADFFPCHAKVNGLFGREYFQAKEWGEEKSVKFTVRYCKKLSELNGDDFRIMFRGQMYRIQHIDNVGYADTELIIRAERDSRWQT